jgi:hypothetical protein
MWRRHTWILEPSLIRVAVRSGDDRQVRHCLLQRLALVRCTILARITNDPANTMAYDSVCLSIRIILS